MRRTVVFHSAPGENYIQSICIYVSTFLHYTKQNVDTYLVCTINNMAYGASEIDDQVITIIVILIVSRRCF